MFPKDTVTGSTAPPAAGSTFDGEVAIALDKDPARGFVYTATVEGVLAPATGGAAPSCIIEKQIRTYRSVMGGPPIADISAGLPLAGALGGAGPIWFTDPWLAVGADGTVFLSALFSIGSPNCATALPGPTANFDEEVQLWVLDPTPGSSWRQVSLMPDPAAPGMMTSQISLGFNAGFVSALDHPRLAANPANANEVVITFINSTVGATSPDQVRTVRRDGTGAWNVTGMTAMSTATGVFTFANPTFDSDGELYIAQTTVSGPLVTHFSDNGAGGYSADAGAGGPTPSLPINPITRSFTPVAGLNIPVDPTTAVAVRKLGGNADPIVYVAYTVDRAGMPGGIAVPITPGVEISAANTSDLTAWIPPVLVTRPGAMPDVSWAQGT